MNNTIVTFLVLLLTSLPNYAQSTEDSVFTAISNLEDSSKIQHLSDACWEYRSKSPTIAMKYGKSAISIMENVSDFTLYSEVNNYLGIISGNLGKLDSAFIYYKIAIDYAREVEDSIQIGYSLNNIGDYYYKSALFSTALENIYKAYEIFEKLDEKPGMAYSLNDIGEIYLKQKNYQNALEYFLRSGNIRMSINDLRGYAKTLLNQAYVYAGQGLNDFALDTYTKAKEYSIKSNYVKGLSWISAGKSEIFFKQRRYDEALKLRNEALELDKKIGNKYGEIINHNQIGAILIKKGRFNEAEKHIKIALKEGEVTGHPDQMLISYKLLKDISVRSGNYIKAYNYLEKYTEVREKVFSSESSNKIADLQTAFITERKERENEVLKKNIEIEQNLNKFLTVSSLLILGFVLLYLSKFYSERKSNNKLNKANKKLNDLNAQKDRLFSIIGHDLKNAAGVIQNYLELLVSDYNSLNDNDKKSFVETAFNSSRLLTKLLIEILEWGRVSRGLVELIEIKLDLKKIVNESVAMYSTIAGEKQISINNNVDGVIIVADKNMLTTILRNFVSNAIKFTDNGGEIDINYKNGDDFHYISVKDNGVGIDENHIEELFRVDKVTTSIGTGKEMGTGLGLPISKEFVKKCDGEILVNSKIGEGSEFIIKLPIK